MGWLGLRLKDGTETRLTNVSGSTNLWADEDSNGTIQVSVYNHDTHRKVEMYVDREGRLVSALNGVVRVAQDPVPPRG